MFIPTSIILFYNLSQISSKKMVDNKKKEQFINLILQPISNKNINIILTI